MLKLLPDALKGAFRTPATRPHPATPRTPAPGARGDLNNDMGTCILCRTCARVCPTGCLTVDKEAAVWRWDPMACVFCGSCVEACPVDSLSQAPAWRPPSSERQEVVLHGVPGVRKSPKGGGPKGDGARDAAKDA